MRSFHIEWMNPDLFMSVDTCHLVRVIKFHSCGDAEANGGVDTS